MASPMLIPTVGFFGRPNGSVASITEVTNSTVNGTVCHNDGVHIPFNVQHEGESFFACNRRFYFADWKKLT
jgi:hypothetical protein